MSLEVIDVFLSLIVTSNKYIDDKQHRHTRGHGYMRMWVEPQGFWTRRWIVEGMQRIKYYGGAKGSGYTTMGLLET